MTAWGKPARTRRFGRLMGAMAVLGSLALVGTACQSSAGEPLAAGEDSGTASTPKPTPTTPQAKISITPKDKAEDVPLDTPIQVKVGKGTLKQVNVTDQDGKALSGELNGDKTVWTADSGLAEEETYRVAAIAVDDYGHETARNQTFESATVDQVLGSDILPEDGATVGVGQPIAITFTAPVEHKDEVEERLEVTTDPMVEGDWRWFGDEKVHWRPKEYWPAGTKVTLKTNLQGLDAGNDVWGVKNKERSFTIGRSVVTKVDLDKHQQLVYVDGKLAKTMQVTGGQPGWETRQGTKVVLAKERNKLFTNEQINAEEDYELISPYAIRITWSGEFLHTASWSTWAHGKQNVSHGCVGMNLENSKWLWNRTQIGDPVETTGGNGSPMDVSGNGFGDWNLSWDEWISDDDKSESGDDGGN